MFFDIGVGLLIASIVGNHMQAQSPWLMLAVGVAGSLWPDIDFLVWLARRKKLDHLAHKHRDLLHKPLMFVPLFSIAVYYTLGQAAFAAFQLASIAHFLHDSIGHGWGIKWLWPLTDRYFCLRSVGEAKPRFYAWTPVQQDVMCEKFGNRHWARQSYGSFGPTLLLESAVILGGVIAAVEYLKASAL